MGVSPHTTRKYLDALEQTFMFRTLQPWHENLGKRLVESPKVYLRASPRVGVEFKREDAPRVTKSMRATHAICAWTGCWSSIQGHVATRWTTGSSACR